jgi:hypothetical protein
MTCARRCPMPSQWRALNSIVDLRRAAADVVAICDMAVYSGKEGEKAVALHLLPARIRTLRFRANRALTALEEDES